jgi:hypothetical protein
MRGDIPWEEEPEVSDNVVAVTFMAKSSATPPTHRPCTKGYRLHCSYGRFQLYDKHIGDTFVFIGRSPSEHESDVVMSIALGKFSGVVQRVRAFSVGFIRHLTYSGTATRSFKPATTQRD